jgi:hypothetical protein
MHEKPGSIRLPIVALFTVVTALGCRRNEGDPNASQITRHAEETREVLENQATWMSRGPTTPQQDEAIRTLRESGAAIERQAQQEAARIRVERPQARGGGPTVTPATIRAIANARCEVEATCGAIPGPQFSSPLACTQAMENSGFMGWRNDSCAQHGFDGDRLQRCLAAIRASTCQTRGNVNLPQCSPDVVCPRH